MPDLFIDDLVVTVTDGHNLVGNPNFEAGTTAGWAQTGGTLAVSAAQAHGGTNSLVDTGTDADLPGAEVEPADRHRQVQRRVLRLAHRLAASRSDAAAGVHLPGPVGSSSPLRSAIASQVAGGTWNQLSGTVTFPPANAPAGCQLTAAGLYVQQEGGTCGTGTGQVECPDIYVDDVSITLAP